MRTLLVRWATWSQASRFRFISCYAVPFFGGFLFLLLMLVFGVVGASIFPDVVFVTPSRVAFIFTICLAAGIFWGWKMWVFLEKAKTGNAAALQAQKGNTLRNLWKLALWIVVATILVMIYNVFSNS